MLSPGVIQEAFVKVTEAAWGNSAPGSPPAQLQPVLQCFCLLPGTTRSQLCQDRRGGCSALCCVTIYDYFAAGVHCLTPAVWTCPATAGMWPVSVQVVSVYSCHQDPLCVCCKQSTLWQCSGACYSSWV